MNQVTNSNLKNFSRHHWYQSWWGIFLIIVSIVVASFVIAFSFYIKALSEKMVQEKNNQTLAKQQAQNLELIEGLNPYYLGTTTPKITIVEFGDFACPYCRESFTIVRDIASLYPDTIKVVWRDFLGHDDSLGLAIAARCAGEQNKFWEMHDGLFLHQGTLTEEGIKQLAQQNNLNLDQFNKCIADKKYANLIAKDESDAKRLGIKGTPTWFINGGYRLEGALTLENLQTIIKDLNQ